MTNFKGRIQIRKINLMGYTSDTQVWLVNAALGNGIIGGYDNAINFLNKHRKHFTRYTDGLGLTGDRIPKFREYLMTNGFDLQVD